jgi:hypothetical protein
MTAMALPPGVDILPSKKILGHPLEGRRQEAKTFL